MSFGDDSPYIAEGIHGNDLLRAERVGGDLLLIHKRCVLTGRPWDDEEPIRLHLRESILLPGDYRQCQRS